MTSSSDLTSAPDAVAALLQRTMDMALGCHRAQQYDEAAHLYAAVLRLQPQHPDANHNLGAIFVEKGDYLGAIPFFQAALQAQSDNFQYWFSLVDALILANEDSLAADVLEDARRAGMPGDTAGQLVERLVERAIIKAKSPMRQVREPSPKLQAQLERLYDQKKYTEVVALGQRLVREFPRSNKGPKALVAAWMNLGKNEQVEPYLQKILENDPVDIDALSNYGLLKSAQGKLIQAEVLLRQALHWAPQFLAAWLNLGIILRSQGRIAATVEAYQKALAINQNDVKSLLQHGLLLADIYQFHESEKYLRKAVSLDPKNSSVHVALGMTLQQVSRVPEALIYLKKAIDLDFENISAFGSYLFVINCSTEISAQERFAAYQEFNKRFTEPLHQYWQPHSNSHNTKRRLRVGYVASTLRSHSSRPFLEPLIANHNPERVETFAYAQFYELPDAVTERYRQYFDHWCETNTLNDEELTEKIRTDGIDILIDIAGQTKGNRLTAFARKPAPVSLHWLDAGYTTGLTAIDYYLTDAVIVPPEANNLFSETPWRLPQTAVVFRPSDGIGEVNPLPALENGYITFGTLTRAVRLNEELLSTWAQLLQRIPNAKLVINSGSFHNMETKNSWIERFEHLGIHRDRLDIGYQSPPWDVLRRIDITLDCFPQNSGTTLIESIYMGLPFVTLSGTPSTGTLGGAILTTLGRPEWITHSKEDYIEKLVTLASDVPALATLRAGLRQEMQASPLMDEPGFARDVEDAYFAMFQHWADTHPETSTA